MQYRVRLGAWTDWSRGAVLGATLTLRRAEGSLLIAFTAFFIGLVASSFWRIVRIGLHRLYSTAAAGDALHHQRQVLLRNGATAPSSLWAFARLAWTWQAGRRALPTAACAGLRLSVAAFAVAGGFSSRISTAVGSAVLLDAPRCALVLPALPRDKPVALRAFLSTHWAREAANSANYAQQCYSRLTSGMFDCLTYVRNRRPATADPRAPCPFPGPVCRSNASNLVLDTGLLDSHHHLGINAAPRDRVLFRLRFHCAPLLTRPYSRDISTPRKNYTQYFYGRPLAAPDAPSPAANASWQVESVASQYDKQYDNRFGSLSVPGFRLQYGPTIPRHHARR